MNTTQASACVLHSHCLFFLSFLNMTNNGGKKLKIYTLHAR